MVTALCGVVCGCISVTHALVQGRVSCLVLRVDRHVIKPVVAALCPCSTLFRCQVCKRQACEEWVCQVRYLFRNVGFDNQVKAKRQAAHACPTVFIRTCHVLEGIVPGVVFSGILCLIVIGIVFQGTDRSQVVVRQAGIQGVHQLSAGIVEHVLVVTGACHAGFLHIEGITLIQLQDFCQLRRDLIDNLDIGISAGCLVVKFDVAHTQVSELDTFQCVVCHDAFQLSILLAIGDPVSLIVFLCCFCCGDVILIDGQGSGLGTVDDVIVFQIIGRCRVVGVRVGGCCKDRHARHRGYCHDCRHCTDTKFLEEICSLHVRFSFLSLDFLVLL